MLNGHQVVSEWTLTSLIQFVNSDKLQYLLYNVSQWPVPVPFVRNLTVSPRPFVHSPNTFCPMFHCPQPQYLLSYVPLSAVPIPFVLCSTVRSPNIFCPMFHCPQSQYLLSYVPLSAAPISFVLCSTVRSPNIFCPMFHCPQSQYLLSYVPLSAVPIPFVCSRIPCPQCVSSGQTDLFTCHTSTVYMHSHRGIRRLRNTLIIMMIINLSHKLRLFLLSSRPDITVMVNWA